MVTISFTVLPLDGEVIDTSGSVLSPLSSSQDQRLIKQKILLFFLCLKYTSRKITTMKSRFYMCLLFFISQIAVIINDQCRINGECF